MKLLEYFLELAQNPLAYGEKIKSQKSRPIVGYLCSYTPEELIAAAGLHPFRLFSAGKSIRLADAHLQGYCCSLVRGVLEESLAGDFSFLDGVVFPHTCDSIQRLSDIWRIKGLTPFHTDLVLPVTLHRESARRYLVAVLARLKGELEVWQKRVITDEDLWQAIALTNQIRRHLQDIYELKSQAPQVISGRELYGITRAAQFMDRGDLAAGLRDLLPGLKERQATQAAKEGKRVILAGGYCDQPDIYGMIEEAGGVVVGDDLCTTNRSFGELIAEEGADPLAALAARYLRRPPCPAKHAGLTSRADHLLALARGKGALGVIFLHLKFCDPHAFDYPYLKGALDRAGIPSLLLELEVRPLAEGQTKTRIEAFLEMI